MLRDLTAYISISSLNTIHTRPILFTRFDKNTKLRSNLNPILSLFLGYSQVLVCQPMPSSIRAVRQV